MVTRACVVAILGMIGLSGCQAALTPTGIGLALGTFNSQVGAVIGTAASGVENLNAQIDPVLPQIMLQRLAIDHNYNVGAQQIYNAPGMVVTVPVIGGITTVPVTVTPPPSPPPPAPPPGPPPPICPPGKICPPAALP